MSWVRGQYYIRSRKVNGRVVSEYVGCGRVGQLAADADALRRKQRQRAAQARRAMKAELAALNADMKAMMRATELVARAVLLAAGYHQHKHGEWRKKRERDYP
jgi:hypothetical protein